MNISAILQAGMAIVRSQIPAVGTVADILAAAPKAREAVQSGIAFLDTLKAQAPPETHAEIEAERASLIQLRAKVIGPGGHADQTIGSLGDG